MQVGKISSFTAINPHYQATAPIQINKALRTDRFERLSFKGEEGNMPVKVEDFGITKAGEMSHLYTITNKNGASVSVSDFGAMVTSIKVPDKNGKLVDVAQGYNNVTPYLEGKTGHPGGTIGPVASKTMNGTFRIDADGEEYQLDCNKDGGKTSSHGAIHGLDIKHWKTAEILEDGVKFTYSKEDGEGGHPGNMDISVTYRFDDDNNLHIKYGATTDKDTILNLTNHTYFNLSGAQNAKEDSILEHRVQFDKSIHYTPANELGIPTGDLAQTEGTAFDFKRNRTIGYAIKQADPSELASGGFDHNFCIDGYDGKSMISFARVKSPETGIVLRAATNLPGFQLYTANNLNPEPAGKEGKQYQKRSALCIEPQFYPNAINTEGFEKPILRAGETYDREIVYSFSTER